MKTSWLLVLLAILVLVLLINSCQANPQSSVKIAFVQDNSVWLMDKDGKNQTPIPDSLNVVDGTVSWSPSGKKLAFWQEEGEEQFFLKVFETTTQQTELISVERYGGPYYYEPPSFSKDEESLYFGRHRGEYGGGVEPQDFGIWKVDISTKKAERVHPGLEHGYADRISVSPDGKWIAFYAYIWEECGALGYLRINGQGLTVLEDILILSFSWSPDSQSIMVVTVSEDDPYQSDSIAIFDFRTQQLKKIFKDPEIDPKLPPVFSSDGQRIIFYEMGYYYIWMIDIDGSNRRDIAWSGRREIRNFSVYKNLVAMELGDEQENSDIWIGNMDEGIRLIAQNAEQPRFSPEQKPTVQVFYLYPVYADLDLDGVQEKAYIKSIGGGATVECPKYLIIEKLDKSGKYTVVYKDKQISGEATSDEDLKEENWTAVFYTEDDEWAKAHGIEPAGLFMSKAGDQKYPGLVISFSAAGGDIREYQYNPKTKTYEMTFGGD